MLGILSGALPQNCGCWAPLQAPICGGRVAYTSASSSIVARSPTQFARGSVLEQMLGLGARALVLSDVPADLL